MNTIKLTQLRNLKQIKFISLITVILFSLTLIQVPLVSASEPVANETGVPVLAKSVDQPSQPIQPVPQDPTAAHFSESPLSITLPPPIPLRATINDDGTVVIGHMPEPVPTPLPQPTEPLQESCLTSGCPGWGSEPITEPLRLWPAPEDHFATSAKEMAVNDLMNSFGFTKEMLDDLIKKGLVKFEVDFKSLQVTVHIDPSVKLPDGALNLTDLLGSDKLPGKINYQLGQSPYQIMAACYIGPDGGGWCPPTVYQLESGRFQIGNRFYELDYLNHSKLYAYPDGETINYPQNDALIYPYPYPYPFPEGGDNRLHSVKIYDGDPQIVCITTPCPTGRLVKEINYDYKYGYGFPYPYPYPKPTPYPVDVVYPIDHITYDIETLKGSNNNGIITPMPIFYPFYPGTLTIIGHITYHNGSQGAVWSRDVEISQAGNGNHIQNIMDYDKNRKLISTSQFIYDAVPAIPECVFDNSCPVGPLSKIVRTDANGNKLSEITNIKDHRAIVELRNGHKVKVIFRTLEDLLRKATNLERSRRHSEHPLAKLFSDSVLNALGLDKYNRNFGKELRKLLGLPLKSTNPEVTKFLETHTVIKLADGKILVGGNAVILPNSPNSWGEPSIVGDIVPFETLTFDKNTQVNFRLVKEYTAFGDRISFGYYILDKNGNLTRQKTQIFSGPDVEGASKSVMLRKGDRIVFYMEVKSPDGNYFSKPSLNRDGVRVHTYYNETLKKYTLAWEDWETRWGADFNDFIVAVDIAQPKALSPTPVVISPVSSVQPKPIMPQPVYLIQNAVAASSTLLTKMSSSPSYDALEQMKRDKQKRKRKK